MSRADPTPRAPGRTPEDRAAEWIARLRAEDCSSDDWDRFCDWRDADDENNETFASFMESWSALDDLAEEPEIVRMRLNAMALEPETPRRPAWLVPLAASIVLTIVTGLSVLAIWQVNIAEPPSGSIAAVEPQLTGAAARASEAADETVQQSLAEEWFAQSYSSAVGQRSKIDLPDGSTVELNTDTLIEVDFTPQRREFRLVRGEVLFDVFPDASRPFIVNSEDDRVIALGTVFSVRRIAGEVVVSLFEGKVQVDRLADSRPGAKPVRSAHLNPGQQLVSIDGLREFRIAPIDSDKALGWRTGRLVFDGDRLRDVVTELNRYSERKLALGDPELGKLRVSGTFRTGSADTFAAALAVALPVSVNTERESGRIVLYAAGKESSER